MGSPKGRPMFRNAHINSALVFFRRKGCFMKYPKATRELLQMSLPVPKPRECLKCQALMNLVAYFIFQLFQQRDSGRLPRGEEDLSRPNRLELKTGTARDRELKPERTPAEMPKSGRQHSWVSGTNSSCEEGMASKVYSAGYCFGLHGLC